MTPRRKYDYALLRQILQDQPSLEKNTAALEREYARRHPKHQRIPKGSLRSILHDHSSEVLGRPYVPGDAGKRAEHDYALIRQIVKEDPELLYQPSAAARVYSESSRIPMDRVYMGAILRLMRAEIQEAAMTDRDRTPLGALLPPLRLDAVNRFAEVIRLYQETDPREHDVLHGGTSTAYYADILADAIHWAEFSGISVETAMISAWETVLLEKSK